jgi:hypothetical protein
MRFGSQDDVVIEEISGGLDLQISFSIDEDDRVYTKDRPSNNEVFESTGPWSFDGNRGRRHPDMRRWGGTPSI